MAADWYRRTVPVPDAERRAAMSFDPSLRTGFTPAGVMPR